MRQETVTEQLRHNFSTSEKESNNEAFFAKYRYRSELEDTHKAIKSKLKEEMDSLESELGKLSRLCADGFDIRDVTCRWDFGRPSNTQKTLVRLDTNEDVKVMVMYDHERQEMLKFEAPAHVLSGPGSLKDKKVTEVPDSDIEYYASRDTDDLLKHQWIQADVDAVFAEAKRRADVKEAAANNVTQMPAPGGGPELVVDNTVNGEGHEADKALASETAGCSLCDSGVPLRSDGLTHGDDADGGEGVPCPVAARNAAVLAETPVEESHTLPSARAVDGPRRGRRSHAPTPLPTAEEREALDQLQAENAPVETLDPRDEAPEL